VIKKMMLAVATAFDVRCEGSATRCKYRGGRAGQGREEIAHVDISEPNSPTNHH
jgi:hypothetical protein